MKGRAVRVIGAALLVGGLTGHALAEDWLSMPYTSHSTYQAVNANGLSAYSGFPVRMIGVVLNNTEDWLDPTANNFFNPYSFQMGGQSELIIQATQAGDFGGTFCWMGQNYGNTYRADFAYSYTNAEWTGELGRLNLMGGNNVTDPIRAGDLVEIRARVGLEYNGKMNVNEAHDNDRPEHDMDNPAPTDGSGSKDFQVVVLQRGYGLPTPTPLPLNLIKNSANVAIFDPTRATDGEHYQTTLVDLKNVRVISGTWGINKTVTVQDASGKTLDMYLGLNSGFGTTQAPPSYFNATGIVDQVSSTGKDGYRLLALDPSGIIRHGDANQDHKVSIQDFNVVLQNFTGTGGTGKTWAQGNFNQAENGSVDIYDFNATVANFTGNTTYGPTAGGSLTLMALSVSAQDAPAAGLAQLLVDISTGEIELLGNAAQINNWDIYSPSSSLIPDADGNAGPWSGYLINNAKEIAAYNGVASFVALDGILSLDAAFRVGGSMDLQFLYAGTDGNLRTGSVVVVPEPAAIALLIPLCVLALRRRRGEA
jgi:hypothetical protein